jgi:hypothetical protein
MFEAKAFRTIIRIFFLFLSERLSANIKLIRSVMTYSCPAWDLAADTYLLKLQRTQNKVLRTQNKVLRTVGNIPRCTPVRDLHTAFNLPYIYDDVTKLCRRQAEVIQNHENEHVRGIGQGKARHIKHKRLKLGGDQACYRSNN